MRAITIALFSLCLQTARAFADEPKPAPVQSEALPASAIHVREGFRVERLISQNSFVALCFDAKGRIYASQQGPRLHRIIPPPLDAPPDAACKTQAVSIGGTQTHGLAIIKDWLYVVRHGDHSQEKFRPNDIVRMDLKDERKRGEPEKIFEFPAVPGENVGWDGEHGVHAIVAGPDGDSIYVVGGDSVRPPSEKIRTPPHFNRDRWNEEFQKEPFPGGWVMRADLDGKNAEVICTGLRNSYDLAFNHRGDLFTFDSDLEFTIGMPDYRPTAIRQIVSGVECGWASRGGAMKWNWPSHWEDIQLPVKNIGPGSPTGLCFGYGTRFPNKYQAALFAADWSYGRLFAVHLKPAGAGYTAETETFLSAAGLPITDLAVSPTDGALYFATGGRGIVGGLYRVTYHGKEAATPFEPKPLDEKTSSLHELRKKLESFHGKADPNAVNVLWPLLGHEERAIRGAARIALEWQPTAEWSRRALTEKDRRIALQAMLALARSTDGQAAVQKELLVALEHLEFSRLTAEEQRWYLRIVTISAKRHGMYSKDIAARIAARIEGQFPSPDRVVNEELVAACAALGSSTYYDKGLDLFKQSRTQEEQMIYAQALLDSASRPNWTESRRVQFLSLAVERVPRWKGGAWVRPARENTLRNIVGMLPEGMQKAHRDLIAKAQKPVEPVPTIARPFVKKWTLDDFTPTFEARLKEKRDLNRGRELFAAAACIACHNFRGEGGLVGPDLSSAGGRYTPRELFENILLPSRVINEQYAMTIYRKADGTQIVGRLVNMSGDDLIIATNLADPGGSEIHLNPKSVESSIRSPVSPMPDGLLNTLTEAEVLDLMAFLTQPLVDDVRDHHP